MEWAPPKESPPFLVTEEDPPEEYGPWQWAAAFGRATGRGLRRCLHITGGWEATLSSRSQPVVERSAPRKCFHESAAVYLAYQTDCQGCSLREQCLASGAKGDRARRVSAVRRLLPPPALVEHKPVLLGPIRWVDVAGRALRRTWMTRFSQPICRDHCALPNPAERSPITSPSSCRAFALSLELV